MKSSLVMVVIVNEIKCIYFGRFFLSLSLDQLQIDRFIAYWRKVVREIVSTTVCGDKIAVASIRTQTTTHANGINLLDILVVEVPPLNLSRTKFSTKLEDILIKIVYVKVRVRVDFCVKVQWMWQI